jgi:Dictyostelium (slime mold) repeat
VISHVAVVVDDNNVCTTDICDPTTGVSNTPVSVDDGDSCTTDACNTTDGSITHTTIPNC